MMTNTTPPPTALERAERILSRRQPAAAQAKRSAEQAEAQVERAGRSVGQGLLRVTARGYVALALSGQKMVDSVSSAWKQSVDQARREQEEQIARTQGAAAAKQEAAEEKRGEKTLRKAFGDAEEAADVAGEAAEA